MKQIIKKPINIEAKANFLPAFITQKINYQQVSKNWSAYTTATKF